MSIPIDTSSHLLHNGPLNLFSHFERRDCISTKLVRHWHFPRLLFQCHRHGVPGDSIVVGSIETGKGLKSIQVTRFIEDLGVEFNGTMGRENPGASAARLFGECWMGCAVRTQEKLGRSASCGLYEPLSMDLGLFTDEIKRERLESEEERNEDEVFSMSMCQVIRCQSEFTLCWSYLQDGKAVQMGSNASHKHICEKWQKRKRIFSKQCNPL